VTGVFFRWFGAGIEGMRRSLSLLWYWEARLKGVRFDGKAVFAGRPIVTVAPNSSLVLGHNVTMASALRSNPLGCFQPCVLRTLSPGARLVVARNSGLSGAVVCAGLSIEIGEGTLIGSGAMIIDNDFHVYTDQAWQPETRANARPVRIGRNVFIGARAIILKGVEIGDRAAIGAGAVVTKNVPPDHIAVGNPASVFPRKPRI